MDRLERKGNFIKIKNEWYNIDHIVNIWSLGMVLSNKDIIRFDGTTTADLVLEEITQCDI